MENIEKNLVITALAIAILALTISVAQSKEVDYCMQVRTDIVRECFKEKASDKSMTRSELMECAERMNVAPCKPIKINTMRRL